MKTRPLVWFQAQRSIGAGQRAIFWLLLLLVGLSSCTDSSKPPPPAGRVVVFAAASLSEAFDACAAAMRDRDIQLRMNYSGSQGIAAQIEQGATGDVFASADERWMNHLVSSGHIVAEPQVFARNRLVVIVPQGNPEGIQRLEDLARPGVKVVLGADEAPIGRYSRQALSRLSQLPGFGTDYAARVLANVASNEDNVKAVVAKVQLGEADAGIVYQSDVNESVSRYAHAIAIPDSGNVVAAYRIAVLRKSANPRAARAFIAFLGSTDGQALLAGRGFLPAATAP